jgi:hypothetical protein
MRAYRVTVAELADLHEMSVVCTGQDCGTRMSLSLRKGILPDRCPSCGKLFDDHLKTAFGSAARFFREGEASDFKVEFLFRDKEAG